jgi:hypothetical protein
MKKILQWMATDGLLHFLVCYAMMLTFRSFIGIWWSMLLTILVALAKEAYDVFVQKDNNYKQAWHDLVCDFAGIIASLLIMQ